MSLLRSILRSVPFFVVNDTYILVDSDRLYTSSTCFLFSSKCRDRYLRIWTPIDVAPSNIEVIPLTNCNNLFKKCFYTYLNVSPRLTRMSLKHQSKGQFFFRHTTQHPWNSGRIGLCACFILQSCKNVCKSLFRSTLQYVLFGAPHPKVGLFRKSSTNNFNSLNLNEGYSVRCLCVLWYREKVLSSLLSLHKISTCSLYSPILIQLELLVVLCTHK